jgi:hypothetical protein
MALASLNLNANTPLYSESFDTAESIADWVGEPGWDGTVGNPGGAVIVSNSVEHSNKNYTVEIPLELTEDSDITITFDALTLENIAGVFHFYAEPEGFPQYFIQFNVEAMINASTYTPLTFVAEDVPASATYLTLRFEMITGAVIGAVVSVAIDNIVVTGPYVDPEGTWKGYTLEDGFWANNVGQLGMLYVEHDPWLFSSALNQWVYLPEGSKPGISSVWISVPLVLPAEE